MFKNSIWFDQFLVAIKDAGVGGSGQWCARHWAPCPLLGANGIGAAVEVMSAWLEDGQLAGVDHSPEALNARLDSRGPVCCQLGDDKMFEIWGHWPPVVVGRDA